MKGPKVRVEEFEVTGEKLLSNQREDGSWVNDNGRWMESNAVLVTAYTVMSLAQVYDSIPE